MKKKIIIMIFLLILVTFFSGITYSFFNTKSEFRSTNQGIASFIFETNKVDYIELNMNDLVPGEERKYLFSVTNSKDRKISDVTIEYELRIKTYHFMPLTIELYKLSSEDELLVGTCDENASRNSENELICNMPIATLTKSEESVDDYKLKVIFPEIYNDIVYSNLVDYINIEIESWQKI